MSLFDSLQQAGVQIPRTEAERNELVISEGSTGFWHYHLSRRGNPIRGLCGAATLPTAMPVSAWGSPGEAGLPKRPNYCEKCARIAWPEAESGGAAPPGQAK